MIEDVPFFFGADDVLSTCLPYYIGSNLINCLSVALLSLFIGIILPWSVANIEPHICMGSVMYERKYERCCMENKIAPSIPFSFWMLFSSSLSLSAAGCFFRLLFRLHFYFQSALNVYTHTHILHTNKGRSISLHVAQSLITFRIYHAKDENLFFLILFAIHVNEMERNGGGEGKTDR